MSAESAPSFEGSGAASARRSHIAGAQARPRRRRSSEQRRRERHFARRRRDLLEDVAVALLLTLILITLTAGLGVIALLELPMAGILLGSVLVPRWRRRQRRRAKPARPLTRRC